MSQNVIFKVGTQAQYDALTVKNDAALYWLVDSQRLYKGDAFFGTGAVATETMAGLLSPEDKAKLDAITDAYTKGEVDALLALKQDLLISGVNIKTINNQSILGEGNINISATVQALTEAEIKEICK